MIINTKGSTRLVILIGKYAIKLPYFRFCYNGWCCGLQGMIANITEKRFSNYSPLFNPTMFSLWGGFLNIQRRAIPITEKEYNHFRILKLFPDTGMVEDKIDSFGWLNGKIVAVDYDGQRGNS